MNTICDPHQNQASDWQSNFLVLLPVITKRLRSAFRDLDADAREEAVDEGIVNCLLNYCRLHEEGRAGTVTAISLAWYAALHVKRGRPAVGRMNGTDLLSRYARISNRIHVDRGSGHWIDTLVNDKRATVEDQVAAKLDFAAWFATLTKRLRQIAKDLAFGFSTSEVARKYGLTAGRISQLRRMLEQSWLEFQREAARITT